MVRKKCPNCSKNYDTELEQKQPDVPVQQEFQKAKPYQREQLITGICSNKCWDEFLGG